MVITEDGLYSLVRKDEYDSPPLMGDIHIQLSGNLGNARAYLLYYDEDRNRKIPFVQSKLEPGSLYRLGDRNPSSVYVNVVGADLYTGFSLSLFRENIDRRANTKALKIYPGKKALVSHLYPINTLDESSLTLIGSLQKLQGLQGTVDNLPLSSQGTITKLDLVTFGRIEESTEDQLTNLIGFTGSIDKLDLVTFGRIEESTEDQLESAIGFVGGITKLQLEGFGVVRVEMEDTLTEQISHTGSITKLLLEVV